LVTYLCVGEFERGSVHGVCWPQIRSAYSRRATGKHGYVTLLTINTTYSLTYLLTSLLHVTVCD